MGLMSAAMGSASAETRSLKLRHLHTGEQAEIVFKRNGRYDPDGLKKINYILRDWRRNEPVKMDPRLLDLVWEAYRASGATSYIQVVCGYRAPATNAMLRSRSRGVAQKSQHVLGKAMDFFIPGVPLKKLRDIGLKLQGGGVGYYPTSGSPFVHMDVGNVRHWPGISRQELVRVFPNGKTLHVPSDGRPLPGYEQALAAYKARKSNGSPAIELASASGSSRKSGGLLAAFFGGGAEESDDEADVAMATPKPRASTRVAAVSAKAKNNLPGIQVVSPDKAQRADIPTVADDEAPSADAVETPAQTPETIIAALPARSVPVPGFAPRPKADVGAATPETVPFGRADDSAAALALASAEPTPDSVPFGKADPSAVTGPTTAADVAATQEPAQIALNNIPLPTWRPDRSAVPADLAGQDQQDQSTVLTALADSPADRQRPTAFVAMVPSQRPDEIKAVLEQADTADAFQVASLEKPRSVFDGSSEAAASPLKAVAARPAGSDPAAAIAGSVKTTRKEARATPSDRKPEPKAKVVAAAPKSARWALSSGEKVASITDGTKAPQLAYNLVRAAPSEVYTDGFSAGDDMANANRFTGSAVSFKSVAKFQTK